MHEVSENIEHIKPDKSKHFVCLVSMHRWCITVSLLKVFPLLFFNCLVFALILQNNIISISY